MSDHSQTALERFDQLVSRVVEEEGTDLLLIADEPPVMRRSSGLRRMDDALPLGVDEVASMARALAGDAIDEIGPKVGEVTRWRVLPGLANACCAIARTHGKLSIAARMVPASVPLPDRTRVPQALINALGSGFGLVVFAGPSGCGKTTSALSLVEHVNVHRGWHIASVEDPIGVLLESKQSLVQQRQVGLDVPDFTSGIRAAMAQDPDLLWISDITDVATLQAAITAASSGHIVVTQMNAADAEDALERLRDVFPPDIRPGAMRQLASVLLAVTDQRLVPKVDSPGYTAAYALSLTDSAIRNALTSGARIPHSRKVASQTLADDLATLVADGSITEEHREQALTTARGRIPRAEP